MTNLGLSSVLVVLDNAETFEDAVDRNEAMRISDFIVHIANIRGATIMLTSRTSSNARRVSWTHFDIPPLEREPARLSFREIYHNEISDKEIDKLLAAIDFHPLSISILAYTARENRWSAKVLSDRWNSQRSELLQSGDGKDNLEFTIRLSLESPSVKALGHDALRVLRIIAFFPQGINQDHLTRLFPSVLRISSITDTLCRVSLVHTSTAFVTMLAPVRLFLETLPIAGLELLKDVRSMYYKSLEEISREKNSRADFLVSDHLNIECLIAIDIAQPPPDIPNITSACRRFLLGLKWHKPRHTSLRPVISSLPEETSSEKASKAECLFALGCLFYELSNFHFAVEVQSAASTLFVAVGKHNDAAVCASNAALAYNTLGYFSRAQQLLHDFIQSSRQYLDEKRKAATCFVLDWSRMHSSSKDIDKLFLHTMDDSWHRLKSRVHHWHARMHHGYNTPEEVQKYLESIRLDCMSSDVWDCWAFLRVLADSVFLQHKFDVAFQLLAQAQELVNGNFSLTTSILTYKSAVASHVGDYDLSRDISKRCIDTLNVVATSSSTDYLRILYIQGRNELYARDYSKAQRFLAGVVAHCDTCGNIETKAFSLRALGEVKVLFGDKTKSNEYFVQTMQLCKEGGVPPELLGVCEPMIQLDDERFPGWKRFLDERITIE
ncbi:hypothetical protein JVU11DRAFT_10363 [Chiua virens]|nr:hypothetical protein JVU11DRAFT_10363 [Chiua virens]